MENLDGYFSQETETEIRTQLLADRHEYKFSGIDHARVWHFLPSVFLRVLTFGEQDLKRKEGPLREGNKDRLGVRAGGEMKESSGWACATALLAGAVTIILLFPEIFVDRPPIWIEVIGAFLGFGLAISADHFARAAIDERKGSRLEAELVREQIANYNTLHGTRRVVLATDMWEMGIATGDLGNILREKRKLLHGLYKGTERYNWYLEMSVRGARKVTGASPRFARSMSTTDILAELPGALRGLSLSYHEDAEKLKEILLERIPKVIGKLGAGQQFEELVGDNKEED